MSNVFPRVFGRELPIVDHAEGALIWDTTGKEYIDGAGGAILVGIGHGDASVIDALEAQARRVSYVHGTQFNSEALERYAAELAELLPLDDAHIYPVSGGSEATETAFKIARSFHLANGEKDRVKVVARTTSYHGNTLNALDASGKLSLRAPYEPWLGRTVRVGAPNEYRCTNETHDACGQELADELDAVITAQGPETVACFIGEPVIGASVGGMVPPDDYWPAVRSVCDRHGVLLIADEVMTGFGRTGKWFASEHWGLRPDIVTAGKGASSGYWPLGFAACSGTIFDALSKTGFVHGFTFSHSVVGAAVGSAVLKRLKEDDLVEASRVKGDMLREMLHERLGDHPHVGDIRGLGLMLGIELVSDRTTKEPFPRTDTVTEHIIATCFDNGLTVYPAPGCAGDHRGDAVLLGPPFVISQPQLERTANVLTDAVKSALPHG